MRQCGQRSLLYPGSSGSCSGAPDLGDRRLGTATCGGSPSNECQRLAIGDWRSRLPTWSGLLQEPGIYSLRRGRSRESPKITTAENVRLPVSRQRKENERTLEACPSESRSGTKEKTSISIACSSPIASSRAIASHWRRCLAVDRLDAPCILKDERSKRLKREFYRGSTARNPRECQEIAPLLAIRNGKQSRN